VEILKGKVVPVLRLLRATPCRCVIFLTSVLVAGEGSALRPVPIV
jgi:hypothetical protein